MKSTPEILAEKVNNAGGKAYYVGGFVRDRILGIENKDVDVEVHGITPDRLLEILKEMGTPLSFGESFGVYALAGEEMDIAMPRKERATGRGHRDFEVTVDPFLGVREAARRRDFTINALMEDILTGEVIDSFGGLEDLKKGVIRHIDDNTFPEDPLRVLRGAQFASRFGFEIADETLELCRKIDISTLSRERIEGELKKALLKGRRPSVFFESLRNMNQLSVWFPELEPLIGLEQDPIYHPEGDVWIHTMEVIDRGAAFREKVSNPYAFMLLCLCHDLGKAVTTEHVGDRIHAYFHEQEGVPIAEKFLKHFTNEHDVISYVLKMIPSHMKPNVSAFSKPKIKSTNHMFDAVPEPEDLIYFSMCDKPVMAGDTEFSGDTEFLFDRLAVYREYMSRPHVTGKDLIEAGFRPGPEFSKLLEYSHKLRLAGIEKDNALKQTLAYARKR